MSRQEEIKAEALSVKGVPEDYSMIDCFRLGFQEGAKWADRTMLDKVCEWLKENVRVFQKEGIGDFILANLRKEMMK